MALTKLDRLARSVWDAHEIADDLAERQVKLSIGGSIHDPTDPTGKLLFNALAMIAEFEADLIRTRTPRRNERREVQRTATWQPTSETDSGLCASTSG